MLTRKTKQNILRFVGLHFLYYILIVLIKTLRIEIKNDFEIKNNLKTNKNFVLAFWHGTMLIPWYCNRKRNFSALVSQSPDGEILVRILERWKYMTIRGSSNIGGKEALELMLAQASQGKNIAVTPDGPKGPIHEMKAGAVVTAKKSGISLYLLGVGYEKKYLLKSWDKFEIPKPFSRVALIYSDQINIDPALSYEDTSALIKKCEIELIDLQRKATEIWLN